MGGISGNAGLFSTAGDVAAFAQMMLNGGIYAHHRLLTRATIQQFTAAADVGDSARTLGWDVPTPPNSSAGPLFFGRKLRAHGLHRNLAVDRPGTATFCDLADQSRESHARKRANPSSSSCRSRCHHSGLGAAQLPCVASITSSAQSPPESISAHKVGRSLSV